MRRVVATGLGLVTPLASGVEATWSRILEGRSGAGPIDRFDASAIACRIAAEVPWTDGTGGGRALIEAGASSAVFNADDWIEPKERRRMDDFIVYGVASALMAFADSGVELKSAEERERAGVMIGSGIGGLPGIEKESLNLAENGPRRVSPFFITGRLINLVSGQVSIRLGLKGPNHAVVTACSSGAHAIGDAARMIALGDADVMLAGGAEAAICPIGVAGFAACKALTTHFNDEPTRASRPYDRDRDGFLIGEGAGILVLEEYERAKARGAKIYGEIIGYGLSGDAYHITAPAEDGDGGYRAMKMALARAGLQRPVGRPRHRRAVHRHLSRGLQRP